MKVPGLRRLFLLVLSAVLFPGLLCACGPRVLYADRSIPALVG